MLKRVLTGTILGLVLFIFFAATIDQVFKRQASQYQGLIDLFFPLREKVDEIHLLLLEQRSLIERSTLQEGTPVAEIEETSRRFDDALSACFTVCFALLDETLPDLRLATEELKAELEPIHRAFEEHSGQLETLLRMLAGRSPREQVEASRLARQVTLQAMTLEEAVAGFEEKLEVHYTEALARASRVQSGVRRLFFALVGLAVLLGTFANVFFYQSLVPLKVMVEAVRDITRGHYEVRVPVEGSGEVSFLAGEFNAMAKALGEQRTAIERSQEVIRATFDGIHHPLVVHDAQDRLLHANPAAWSLAASRGLAEPGCFRRLLDFGGDCPGLARTIEQEVPSTFRVVHDPESGASYEVSCETVAGSEGELRFVVEFVRDITERLQLERFVRQSEKLSAIGELSLGVAHEVRNPLSTIQMSLHALGRRPDLSRPERERVELAQHEVERLEGLVSSLLEYGRPTAPRIVAVDIPALIERSVDLVEGETARCRVSVRVADPDTELPEIEVDGNQIIQVLVNLLLNAVQASPVGGEVRVRATASTGGPGEAVSIQISDDGTGIDPRELKRIFTPFFTTRRDGTGLGLPVARKIAEAHGGSLVVDSAPGRGTTAVLRLPVRPVGSELAPGAA